MHVGTGNAADHVGGADLARRRLVEAGGIAHHALDQMVQDRERDIDQQQAGNRFIDAAVLPQAPRQHDPEAAADHPGTNHRNLHDQRRRPWHRQRRAGGGERADQERAFTADNHHTQLRGQCRAQRGQDQGCGAGQGVLPGEPGPERALIHVEIEVERALAEQGHEYSEHRERADQRRARNQDVFDGAAVALEEAGIGGRSYSDRLHWIRRVCCHEVAPITPSTR
jgi:hypothetical protein